MKFTEGGFTTSVKPSTENPKELKNKYKKDIIDKYPYVRYERTCGYRLDIINTIIIKIKKIYIIEDY
ncbi:MAG: hypothetical protein IKN87_00625 [Bacilli bacterium]|nr:hypothetical protein [Bacilli bacterium]